MNAKLGIPHKYRDLKHLSLLIRSETTPHRDVFVSSPEECQPTWLPSRVSAKPSETTNTWRTETVVTNEYQIHGPVEIVSRFSGVNSTRHQPRDPRSTFTWEKRAIFPKIHKLTHELVYPLSNQECGKFGSHLPGYSESCTSQGSCETALNK